MTTFTRHTPETAPAAAKPILERVQNQGDMDSVPAM